MNKELLEKILILLKGKVNELEEKNHVLELFNNFLNLENLYNSFINLSEEQRNIILTALNFNEDEINKLEYDVKIAKEPVGFGEIWLKISNMNKESLQNRINDVKQVLEKTKTEYEKELTIYKDIVNFIQILEKEDYSALTLEQTKNIISVLSLYEKEKIEFLKAIVIEHSKYLENKMTKTINLVEVETNIDEEIDDLLTEFEIEETYEEEIIDNEGITFVDVEGIKSQEKEHPIVSYLGDLNPEQRDLVAKMLQYLHNKSYVEEANIFLFDSYIELCENLCKAENNFEEFLNTIYEQNKNTIFTNRFSIESFIVHYIEKTVNSLYEALKFEVDTPIDEKEKQDLIAEILIKLEGLYKFYSSIFSKEETKKEKTIVNTKDVLIYGIEDNYSNLDNMESNLKNNYVNVLQKLHYNKGIPNTFKKDKEIHYIVHNNVVIYFVKVNQGFLILSALRTGEDRHGINSVFTLKNSQKVKSYINRLINEPEFYNEILQLSEEFYNGGVRPENKGGMNV